MSSLFTQVLGVDFGTANLSISDGQRGTLLREPSVAAISAVSGELLAVGEAASMLIRQTPGEVVAKQRVYFGLSGCPPHAEVFPAAYAEKQAYGLWNQSGYVRPAGRRRQ